MATTDDYGQGVSVATLTDPPNAETLAKNLASGIVPRTVMRFASASSRSATVTSPVEGMVTWLQDLNRLYVYDGSAWVPVGPIIQSGTVAMSWTNVDQATASVTFPVAFPATPRVFININNGTGVVARWISRATNVSTSGFTAFLFAAEAGGTTTGSNVDVHWFATSP
ncbi:hypothetical protein NLX86_18745 [Streptomyces sp. A3M-1-3]|uniref:H-type lectin domain-containing protein n=1 Tax=Streptomyces sp. A3M-1-3 TaxID=2962044 RepID=UPI0020B86259|nr:H-type lectin domain-containing protein [Streptomyces sp. A3M-1-3]MCP3820056.1 hypothetical protein [Streptomyces sp. A3M-1-3]